ncbi:hypothetical protein OIE69_35185 [Actinacidiphila glaucinigra]|uniref:hypothetical protein n=1 Tax=Actinacidiphila glaucinigra TaxID=235986 RepID=UPI002DDAC588|nr:hypothetical protein [Actinacidiphila glaucinigra]WSD63765.1 hypothetical protein OIE69_35185 [Actinacidiphila glaucinigra]
MGIAGMTLTVVILVLAGVARRLHRYPGGWRFALSGRHDTDRDTLDRARRAVRKLRRRARRELAGARAQVARADRSHRRRVGDAERHLDRLRRPGRGAFVATLGKVSLHEHVMVISGPQTKVLPLDCLEVRFEHSQVGDHIYLRRPDGVHLESFTPGEHAEDAVRRFSVRIENAVAKERAFLTERARSVKKAEDDLKAAHADTGAAEDARRRLGTVTARQRRDPALAEALAGLEAARDQWHGLTGRRPPR